MLVVEILGEGVWLNGGGVGQQMGGSRLCHLHEILKGIRSRPPKMPKTIVTTIIVMSNPAVDSAQHITKETPNEAEKLLATSNYMQSTISNCTIGSYGCQFASNSCVASPPSRALRESAEGERLRVAIYNFFTRLSLTLTCLEFADNTVKCIGEWELIYWATI
jgi:hypothetical protein